MRTVLLLLFLCVVPAVAEPVASVTAVPAGREVRAVLGDLYAGPGGLFRLDGTPVAGAPRGLTFLGMHEGRVVAGGPYVVSDGALPASPVDAWASDGERVWCAAGGRLWRRDGATWTDVAPAPREPNGAAALAVAGGRWLYVGAGVSASPGLPSVAPRGRPRHAVMGWVATDEGLFRADGPSWRRDEPGTPVTALALHEGAVYAAVWRGGVFRRDASGWTQVVGEPLEATCLDGLRVGTRRHGVWPFADLSAHAPASPVVAMQRVGEDLWASTWEDGLWRRREGVWEAMPSPSVWMRHLALHEGRLYARDTEGGVWTCSEEGYRREAVQPAWTSCLRSAGGDLLVGGYGGFRAADRFHRLPGQVVTDVLPDGDGYWVGTARNGAFRVGRDGSRPVALRDPWVTTLALLRGAAVAGTFNGGLVELGSRADRGPAADTRSRHVTALASLGGASWAATRGGLYLDLGGGWTRIPLPDDETLAVLPTERGALVSTRSGLFDVEVSR